MIALAILYGGFCYMLGYASEPFIRHIALSARSKPVATAIYFLGVMLVCLIGAGVGFLIFT